MSAHKLRKKTILVFFLVVPLMLALLTGELYIRLFREYTTPEIIKKKSFQYIPSLFSQLIFPEKEQIIIRKKYNMFINSKGYRGNDFPSKKNKGTVRIIIYGGSSVFDIFQEEGKDWPHRTEQMLKERGISNIEVINAGIPALRTFDSFGRLFSDGWTLEPDIVILYEAWNDISWYFTKKVTIQKCIRPYNESDDFRISYQSSLDKFLCESSQLYVRLRERYYNWKYNIGIEGASKRGVANEEINQLGLKQYKLNLEMFVELARNIHAIPILVTQARLVDRNNTLQEKERIGYKYTSLNHMNIVKAFEKTDEIIKEVSAAKQVHMIDPSGKLSGKSEFFKDHVHTTEEGSYQLAKIISKGLLDLIKN